MAVPDAREPDLHFEITTSSKLLAGVPYLIDRYRCKSESDEPKKLHTHDRTVLKSMTGVVRIRWAVGSLERPERAVDQVMFDTDDNTERSRSFSRLLPASSRRVARSFHETKAGFCKPTTKPTKQLTWGDYQ